MVPENEVQNVVKSMKEEHGSKAHGDIYSALGGREIHVLVENSPAKTKGRPYYE